MLRFAGYCSVFLFIVGYPFTDGLASERRFLRLALAAILITGFLVATLGLFERVYWNGKILWIFVPEDWGAPHPGIQPRASGPFVNPNHFANYLSMILPLAWSGALFGFFSQTEERDEAIRLGCGLVGFVIFIGILLSLSRAGWIEGTASGVIVSVLWLTKRPLLRKKDRARQVAQRMDRTTIAHETSGPGSKVKHRAIANSPKVLAVGESVAIILIILSIALLVVGPQGRTQSTDRLADTVTNGDNFGARPIVWRGTLEMIRDFPVFGLGLAAWPELFPHYQVPPWSSYYFREAHNDYLQYGAETGLIGLAGLGWFLFLVGSNLFKARFSFSGEDWPILVALVLALASMAFHEIVDFSLHVPANAILCAVLLGVAIRLASTRSGNIVVISTSSSYPAISAISVMGVSIILVVLALCQKGLAYPYDIAVPASLKQARAVVWEHPASAQAHLSLLTLADPDVTRNIGAKELAAAIWLDPTNPFSRDLLARTLARAGRQNDAMGEVRESVFDSPTPETHPYLDRTLIPWLLPIEQTAVEEGFEKAIAAGFPGAVDGLAFVYDVLGRLSDESHLFQDAAKKTASRGEQGRYLTLAGDAADRSGDERSAEVLLRRAMQTTPFDAGPYTILITKIYGPAGNLSTAASLVAKGIQDGADATQLYLALASASQTAGDKTVAEATLLKALALDPRFEIIMRVAQFYFANRQFEKAAELLENATEINPSSAEAFYALGNVEEEDYQYSEADKAYARAAALAPKQFQGAYVEFRHRIDTSRENH